MQKTRKLFALMSILALHASLSLAQDSRKQKNKQAVAPAASNPVVGSGAAGQITKWTGVDGSNTYTLGDTNITEDKFGKVGIGTRAPTSSLTVRGSIETTFGGFKFPDGTVQTTAIDPNQVVRSLNGLTGNLTLAEGANITITESGNTFTIGAANALTAVAHDATLQGNGTLASPLGVAVPLNLSGPLAVINATNSGSLVAVSGKSVEGIGVRGEGLVGVLGVGIDLSQRSGGDGVVAAGGQGSGLGKVGGDGITAIAGPGIVGATNGLAGSFAGDVNVAGRLTKTIGTFKIDHPLDPENKYLYHSFVESPDMMNIYNGNITTDENGEAVVEMPDYFDALNKDFRYQLTVIGTFAQAIVASEIKDNRFVIRTNAAGVKVSWMVTGVRHDAYADKHRIKVEEMKAQKERGYYLHPEVFNQPEERSIDWARHPEMMQKLKQQTLKAKRRSRNSDDL